MLGLAAQLSEGAQILAAIFFVKNQLSVSPRFFACQQVV
jgi:hypothetical protein